MASKGISGQHPESGACLGSGKTRCHSERHRVPRGISSSPRSLRNGNGEILRRFAPQNDTSLGVRSAEAPDSGCCRISGGVGMTQYWLRTQFGIESLNPFTNDLDAVAESGARVSRLLAERYPDLPLGDANAQPQYSVPQHDGRIVAAVAYGAGEPTWSPDISAFWSDRANPPWGWVQSPADVARIRTPDWESIGLVQQMAAKWEEVKAKVGEEAARKLSMPWTCLRYGGGNMAVFPTFVDMGPFLLGDSDFFMILASDPDLARALMDKCFEISVSWGEFTSALYGTPIEGLCGFGGDNSCVLSPEMYERYGMGFDLMLYERYGDLPCNLHSCGPSAHLYDVWRKYPNREHIVLMQTRGIPGELRRLKEALPHTFLQITLHPPQFDFESETPESIRAMVWQLAEEAGFSGMSLHAIIARSGEQVDANIRAFYKAIDEVNAHCKADS
jgi:hypothetical protein